MADRDRWGEIRLRAQESAAAVVDDERPAKIAIVGDFSGRGWQPNPKERTKPVAVDVDNFDAVLEWHQPEVDAAGIRLRFWSLDDFHPERLCENPDLFLDLETEVTPGLAENGDPPQAGGDFLDAILGQTEQREERMSAGGLAGFIEEITAPHRERRKGADEIASEAAQNEAESKRLRQILHHPAFEAIEGAWRGLDFALREMDASAPVRLFLMDASRAEIVEGAGGLADRLRAGEWDAVVLLASFEEREVEALAEWAAMARGARTVVLAGAGRSLETGSSERWKEFRRRAEAGSVGLVSSTRMLLRLPYGNATSPVDGREFEEMPEPPVADLYTWGHGAWATVALLGAGFSNYGWEFRLSGNGRIGGRPVHSFRKDGEAGFQACADRRLGDEEMDELLNAGLMPLTAAGRPDELWLARWQSVAQPLKSFPDWKRA
ncbi:MAG: type VI secretion system contractile sheath large subunit [Bryobacteraceae bacterium]